jgi:5-methylcytosine-specific restriction endonuclease McrA
VNRVPLGRLREIVCLRERGWCQHCGAEGTQLHHALFRDAGGTVLDRAAVEALKAGTFNGSRHTAHLMWLCHGCHHTLAHGPDNVALGLRILGEVTTERWSGQMVYQGPDERMAALWPREDAA